MLTDYSKKFQDIEYSCRHRAMIYSLSVQAVFMMVTSPYAQYKYSSHLERRRSEP